MSVKSRRSMRSLRLSASTFFVADSRMAAAPPSGVAAASIARGAPAGKPGVADVPRMCYHMIIAKRKERRGRHAAADRAK